MTDDPIRVARPDRAGLARELLNAFWPVLVLTLLTPFVTEESEQGAVAALLVVVVLPLALRERWPALVLLVSILGTIVTADATGTPIVQMLAVALASYTTGERSADRTRSAVFVLFVAALSTIGIIAQGAEPFEALVISFVVLVPAWLLGDIIRSRRVDALRRAEAQQRSLAEREQQTASGGGRRTAARRPRAA